ncbi:MAG TPA: hypothetical protein VF120_01580 [Ktedonobacterales bacterium]
MKTITMRLMCADEDILVSGVDNKCLGDMLEGVIGPAVLTICGHVVIVSVTVEDAAQQGAIPIAALLRGDERAD